MKKYKKVLIILVSIILTAVVGLILWVYAISKSYSAELNLHSNDEQNIIEELKLKDLHTLLLEAGTFAADEDSQDIEYVFEAITEILPLYAPEKITCEFLDNEISDEVKTQLLLICEANDIGYDFDKVSELLKNENTASLLKNTILDIMSTKGSEYENLILSELKNENEETIFRSMIALQNVDIEKAEEIAEIMLQDNSYFGAKHKAALIIIANILAEETTSEKLSEYICLCDEIIFDYPCEDEEEKQISVIYALSKIKRFESFNYLMNLTLQKAIDFRSYIVEENSPVLKQILSEEPTVEKADLVICSYGYSTNEKELLSEITHYYEENKVFFNENPRLLSEISEIIK